VAVDGDRAPDGDVEHPVLLADDRQRAARSAGEAAAVRRDAGRRHSFRRVVELAARRAAPRLAVALVALLVPFLVIANGLYAIAQPWFVRFEYGAAGVPPDRFGWSRERRTELALVGLDSILPWQRKGIGVLRGTRLSDGRDAFDRRELRHMGDVRRLVAVLLALHAVGLVLIAGLLFPARARPLVARGLRAGALLVLGSALLVAVSVAANAVGFLTAFHGLFFAGDSWRFAEHDTLRRLYPDRFWRDTALALGAGAALQALVLLGLGRLGRVDALARTGEAGSAVSGPAWSGRPRGRSGAGSRRRARP
jgi:hypothetical protein